MNVTEKETPVFRFESYTADLRSGELRKFGTRIPLQIQPFQILSVFLEKPNELVTREELQRKLWPSDTFVDFDHGLNKAINKLRDALCDTAEEPRFIQTVPRRGYRFVAPVVVENPPVIDIKREAPEIVPEPRVVPVPAPTKARHYWVWGLALVAVVAASIGFWVSRPTPTAGSPTLAVMPLATPAASGDYDIADGMTDGLINDLSYVPGLKVISHASVFQYRNKVVDAPAAGRKLGASAVLTGRAEQAGSTLLVVVELISTKDGSHIWGQQYTRNVSERGSLQREIAASVGDALSVKLTSDDSGRKAHPVVDDEAQQLYLNGRYYFFKQTPEDVSKARDLFRKAIDRDPTYALAWAALGDSYDWMATEGFQPLDEVLGQSQQAKQKANELDPFRAEVHSSLAALNMVQWRWPQAEVEFQRGLAINPNDAPGHGLYSIYLRTMKRFPEALQQATAVTELDPLSMPAKSNLALTYYYARQYDAAARQYRLIVKEFPNAAGAHAGLASVLLHMGKENEAVGEWAQALVLAGDGPSAENLRRAYARGGLAAARAAVLQDEINDLKQAAGESYVSPVEFAYRYALLNDKDNAFLWLEKAYSDRSPQLFNLNVDPDYDSLRDDPRFAELLTRLHVPA